MSWFELLIIILLGSLSLLAATTELLLLRCLVPKSLVPLKVLRKSVALGRR